jgi:hypothetical protein
MKQPWKRRLGLGFALLFALIPLYAGRAGSTKADDKNQQFKGAIVPLSPLLAKSEIKLDADAAPYWLALKADDGKLYSLVKDAGARMFFKDAKLLNRPMRLTGKLLPGSQLLQVVNVHSYIDGKLHEVYYWCDICTIRGYEAGICDCCGGPMERREVPVKE